MENQNPMMEKNNSEIPKSKMSRSTLVMIIIIAIAGVASISGLCGYFLYSVMNQTDNIISTNADQTAMNTNASNQSANLNASSGLNANTNENANIAVVSTNTSATDQGSTSISSISTASSEIAWSELHELPSLKMFGKKEAEYMEESAKYYKSGSFTSGKYKGADFILVSAQSTGPSLYPDYWRFAKQGTTYTLLQKYSSTAGADSFSIKYTVDKAYTIAALDYPKTFIGSSQREVFVLQEGVNALFAQDEIKKVFTDPKLGDVFMTANPTEQSSSIFNRNGFYLKAADGTVKVYALQFDFVDASSVPQITWIGGAKNTAPYSSADASGCGNTNYASVVAVENPKLSDYKQTGINNKGDRIYELQDENSSILKNMYENEYSAYIVIKGEDTKISYEKFVAEHPLLYWIDSFGRMIRFKNATFIPQAECGKPVIYLYPEKTANVSVKVEPRGGMSYSDPVYGNGWNVVATPESDLTEISSGKSYPYLFWEGKGGIYEQPKQGFVIEKSDVHAFLVEKLSLLGLNSKETADFLEFWEPRMREKPYYFVTFLMTNEMNRLAPLTINPAPDTVIRILMDFTPLDQPIEVQGFDIKTPVRKGFTVVEWGGVIR